MARITYREIDTGAGFYALVAFLGLLTAGGLASAWYMETHGHVVTGMSNEIVWGLPHVFAVFLILAASGALNVASIASVFGREDYKPMARLSGLLAIALLVAGLGVLVLDLGRPERLIVAMTTYNFKSIFAWNIFLYTGFLLVVGAYLFVQMARGTERYVGAAGLFAFVWRLILTTGTGSIFGWLVARQAYDAAIMAPLFIALSLMLGHAVFGLVLMAACAAARRPLDLPILQRLVRLLAIFAAATLYFAVVQHLTNLYWAKNAAVAQFVLVGGGVYTALFWGFVAAGALAPIALVFHPNTGRSRAAIALAALLAIAGGLALLYVIIIGGQAYPLVLFPGMEISSSFHDGVVAPYRPSLPELGLGIGGVAFALLVTAVGLAALRFLPMRIGETLPSAEGSR
jgi:molybdopterin-containing oxidoreductase family membrane subunit